MLLTICGFISSGKDTIANYLVEQKGFQRETFAGALKDSVSVVFGWDRDLLEGNSSESRQWRETVDEWWAHRLDMPHLTPRWVLQYWGTEVARYGFHNDIWTAVLEKRILESDQHIVVSDCRFPNEVDMLKRLGGSIVRVKRGPEPEWYQTAVLACQGDPDACDNIKQLGIHSSEWSWLGTEFDHIIENEGSIQDLYSQIDQLIISN